MFCTDYGILNQNIRISHADNQALDITLTNKTNLPLTKMYAAKEQDFMSRNPLDGAQVNYFTNL